MLGKNQKPTLVCLRKGGTVLQGCLMEMMGGPRWNVKGLEGEAESFLPLSFLSFILYPDWLLCWNVQQQRSPGITLKAPGKS